MSEMDIVKDRAKAALTIRTRAGALDIYLWDRAQRLADYVKHISGLPELAQVRQQLDSFCLTAATYFSDAGLARSLEANNTAAQINANSAEMLELSAQIVAESLCEGVEAIKIEKIKQILIESGSRFTKMTEAMILSDARNLDDTGLTGIFNELRREIREGKGIEAALQDWKRKIDYRYWQARLKKSFHFEQVRKAAEQRLSGADYIMSQLRAETSAQDLKGLIIGQREGNKESQQVY
ncbi:MAG: hypothetical protein ACYS8Y_05595 [Planctomycetota bacterium]|jgi:hypothetical protein